LVPDAPTSLTTDAATTDNTQIRFTWADGASDGGATIIDYSVYYDQGSDEFILLDGSVTDQFYLTIVSLTAGEFYKFKVTARNSVGTSSESEVLTVQAARVADKPINLADKPEVTTAY
jgi:hypothetical protein